MMRIPQFPFENRFKEALKKSFQDKDVRRMDTVKVELYYITTIDISNVSVFSLKHLMEEVTKTMKTYMEGFRIHERFTRLRYNARCPFLILRWSNDTEVFSESLRPRLALTTGKGEDEKKSGVNPPSEEVSDEEEEEEISSNDDEEDSMKWTFKKKKPKTKRFEKPKSSIQKKVLPREQELKLRALNLPLQHHEAFGEALRMAYSFQGPLTPARIGLTVKSERVPNTGTQKVMMILRGVQECLGEEIFDLVKNIRAQKRWSMIQEWICPRERSICISMQVFFNE